MKKRRFIAAITALMCAGTVFVPTTAVTAAAETQTSAVQTNYLDSIRSDIENGRSNSHDIRCSGMVFFTTAISSL